MRNKITLKELSKLLNVSVSTVSKALNDSPEISQKTIERVKELAKLHNYRPNPTAVNLKSSKSGTIAVIVPNISNAFFAKVLSGIEEQAQKKGLQLITYISNESYKREKQIVDMITYGFVDGVLIAPSEETQKLKEYAHLQELLEYELPVVLYDRTNFELEVDKVGVDDQGSFHDAVNFFAENGLNKIGLVSAIQNLDTGKLRIEGFQEAMRARGMNPYVVTSEEVETLKSKIGDLLDMKVQGIISTDLLSTVLTSRVAFERNINIPAELKLLGYVNEESAPYLSPSLSYIDQHPKEIGATALNFLVDRINSKDKKRAPLKKILKTDMVHLESTRF